MGCLNDSTSFSSPQICLWLLELCMCTMSCKGTKSCISMRKLRMDSLLQGELRTYERYSLVGVESSTCHFSSCNKNSSPELVTMLEWCYTPSLQFYQGLPTNLCLQKRTLKHLDFLVFLERDGNQHNVIKHIVHHPQAPNISV